ncbi:MAG: class I SAM-dependent methyltransferase [Bdellovibrionaceae bacterium]|nr:class I SAM-dependent methyltransferase [Pseudobdellovibrionaceae bacterium]NUM57038.1 methyltransferase domain-containing protein [Pseudobdellovibrionaceae bacterium]
MEVKLAPKIKKNLLFGYSAIRSANFTLQASVLPLVQWLATRKKRDLPKSFSEHFRQTLPKLQSLLLKDSENISNNIYPVEVLLPESPVAHVLRLPVIIVDAFAAAKRREKKETKEFQERLMDLVEETPEYYKRNFHFQTNGYFGEDSAKIYDHQVEVLFSGTADAMRRLIIPRLKKHFNNDDGLGKHFLEIGCGTGSLTRFIALAFPKAKITCVDLSSSYLKVASQRLKKFDRINYLQGAAESLSLKSETFDAVFSCFLFHELPKAVRLQVIHEGKRLLRPGGFYGLVDSIQKDDDVSLNWALEQFPMDYHEPFYKDYIQNSIESLFKEAGLKSIESEFGFFAKVVTGVA